MDQTIIEIPSVAVHMVVDVLVVQLQGSQVQFVASDTFINISVERV